MIFDFHVFSLYISTTVVLSSCVVQLHFQRSWSLIIFLSSTKSSLLSQADCPDCLRHCGIAYSCGSKKHFLKTGQHLWTPKPSEPNSPGYSNESSLNRIKFALLKSSVASLLSFIYWKKKLNSLFWSFHDLHGHDSHLPSFSHGVLLYLQITCTKKFISWLALWELLTGNYLLQT